MEIDCNMAPSTKVITLESKIGSGRSTRER